MKKKCIWVVKRYVVEHIQVKATSKHEAVQEADDKGDLYRIDIIKVTAKKQKVKL